MNEAVERQRAEEALRESERRLRAVFDGTYEYIGFLSPDGTLLEANQASLQFAGGGFGGKREDVVGRPFWETIWFVNTPGAAEALKDGVARAARGEFVRYDAALRRPSGEVVVFDSSLRPVHNDAGEVTLIVPEGRDVTELRRAEEALRASAQRQAYLLRLSDLLRPLADAAAIQGEACRLLGECLQVDRAYYVEIDEAPGVARVQRDWLRGGAPSLVGVHRTSDYGWIAPFLRRGETVAVADAQRSQLIAEAERAALAAIHSAANIVVPLVKAGAWVGALCVTERVPRDWTPAEITLVEETAERTWAAVERANAENELRAIQLDLRRAKEEAEAANAALREADRRKNEFLATLAHELRNPLAPLRSALEILKLTGGADPTCEQARGMIERQLTHIVRLIDDLLDVSRISHGKLDLRKEPVDLARVIHQAVETSLPLIEAGGLELTLDVPPVELLVDADVVRLAQVFSNLLNNAAKYTERGGRVALRVERQDGAAMVSVRDNGIGISAAMLPKLFEMFTQADRSLEKSRGGLGIGLALVKRLVEMHGGAVEVKSGGHGKGSEFVVRLPLATAPLGARFDDAHRDVPQPSARRILVVDDNQDAALSLAMLLKVMGHETRMAFDGVEALDAVAEFRPDFMLLDIGMPRLNGYEVARRIREQPWGKNVVLAALTGWGQEEDRRQSAEAGFNMHIVKPVDAATLKRLLSDGQRNA